MMQIEYGRQRFQTVRKPHAKILPGLRGIFLFALSVPLPEVNCKLGKVTMGGALTDYAEAHLT